MSKVRCKFRVSQVVQSDSGQGKKFTTVKMVPIWAGADADGKNVCVENRILSDATPQGSIELGIANEAAADHFAPGQDWYVDLIPA